MERLLDSFKHAFAGIGWVVKEHPNFKIHIIISLIAIFAGYLLEFSHIEFAILLLTVLVVYTAEMVNTAVEEVTDLVTVKWAKQAKIAKDVAAGGVLLSALVAIIIGFLLFLPKLLILVY